jgi:transposase-like protein
VNLPLPQIEIAAREYLEKMLWDGSPVCPRCENGDRIYKLESDPDSRYQLRHGVYKCGNCQRQFTATVRTILEDTHIAVHKWIEAFHLLRSKGASALEIQRKLQLGSYRSAWFLCKRIRWAMTQCKLGQAEDDEAVRALLRVKPTVSMPRPGAHRQTSVWAQVDEELHGWQKREPERRKPATRPK